jgi:hypothetical protein
MQPGWLEASAPRLIGASADAILHGSTPENLVAVHDTAKSYNLEKS